jgi:hypothetical protein
MHAEVVMPVLPANSKKKEVPPVPFPPLLTRQQMLAFLNANGIPIGESTLEKFCSPRVNQGPPVSAWWGRRALYEQKSVLAWAKAMMRHESR